MLRPRFQCRWSISFHRGLPLSYLFKHWGRLISCQGVQRLVSENQLTPESLNWFLDFKMSGKRHCLKCTLKIAVCSEELMEEWILCFNILKMLSYSFGKPGDYDHVYFMFVSQLYPHHEQFKIHEWSMIRLFTRNDWCNQAESKQILLFKEVHHQMMTIPFIQISMVMFHQMMMRCWVVMNQMILWMMIINLITILDLIQMMMIKSTSSQMIMDHHLMMIWICQEYKTRGKHINQVHHQLRFPILTFPIEEICWSWTRWRFSTRTWSNVRAYQSSKETETDLNWFYWCFTKGKGKGDYQEAKGSITRSCSANFSSYSETSWIWRWRTLHMILLPQVSHDNTIPLPTTTPTSFTPGDFAQPAQQQSSQGTPEIGIITTWWWWNRTIWKQTTLLFWLGMTLLSFRKKMWTLNLTHQTTLILSMLMVLFLFL